MTHTRKTLIWLMLFTSIIIACENVATPVLSASPCKPADNSYDASLERRLIILYENAAGSINSNEDEFSSYQRAAFTELVNYVYDSSDFVNIDRGEKTVRIVITYISPPLAHAILINHYLFRRNPGFVGIINDQVKKQMAGIFSRREHVFFIMFMVFNDGNNTNDNSSTSIDFPLKNLQLTNTSNSFISKQHDDHNLEKMIVLRDNIEHGFFYFPLAVNRNGVCQDTLDKNRDTRFVLTVPNIGIDKKDMGPRSWEFKYAPLLNVRTDSLTLTPRFIETLSVEGEQITPGVAVSMPRSPNKPDFWISLARIIWQETTLDP